MRKKLLPLLLFLFALPVFSQDCTFQFTFSGNATQTGVANLSKNTPCPVWMITLSVTGSLSVTADFQTSPDNSNWTSVGSALCSSTQQAPCIIQGANPIVGTQGMAYVAAYGSYVRMVISSSSGSGTGTIRAYGARGATTAAAKSPGAGGGGGGGKAAAYTGWTNGSVTSASAQCFNLAGIFSTNCPPTVAQGNFTPLPTTGTLGALYVLLGLSPDPSDSDITVTVLKNGSPTAVTFIVPSGSTSGVYTDLVHTVSWSAGDQFSLKVSYGGVGIVSPTGWSFTIS
jgi:hypothetical protein